MTKRLADPRTHVVIGANYTILCVGTLDECWAAWHENPGASLYDLAALLRKGGSA